LDNLLTQKKLAFGCFSSESRASTEIRTLVLVLKGLIYPYLLRGLAIGYPNYVWDIDITCILLQGDWMYLAAILDWFSHYLVSRELDQTMELPFVLNAVDCAL